MVKILDSYIYSVWCWVGMKTKYLHKYSRERDASLVTARKALEEAFTPKIRKMLEDNIVNDK